MLRPALPRFAPLLALLPCLLLLSAPGSVQAAAHEDIASANAAGRTVFLVLTDAAAQGTDDARAAARRAQELAPASTVVELNRSDPASAPVVERYRLKAAPVPLVLVIASNGVAAGAQKPGKGAAERLVALIPTPKKAEALQAFQDQKRVLLAFTRAGMAEQSALFEAMTRAVQALENTAVSVVVSLDDPAEARFLAEKKVDAATAQKPVLFVLNAKGQTLGRLEGAPTAEKILETAKRPAPCCADGACKDCGK